MLSEKIKEAISVWIEIALNDLKSARLLYEHEQFSNSYFLFQQSVEKANKAFALLSGKITVEELEDFKHDQFKIYRKLLVAQREQAHSTSVALDSNPNPIPTEIKKEFDFKSHYQTLDKSVRFIDSLRNLDLINLSASELNYFLRELKKLEKVKLKIPKNAKEIVYVKLANFIGAFGTEEAMKMKSALIALSSEETDELWNVILQTIPLFLDVIFVNLTLYFCALLTIQHSSLTRYPDEGDSPLWLYDLDLPIVKKQPLFMNYMDKALIKLQALNS